MRMKEYIFMRVKVLDMKMHPESHLIYRKHIVHKSDEDYIVLTFYYKYVIWSLKFHLVQYLSVRASP